MCVRGCKTCTHDQAEYLKNKVQEIIDAKQIINIFKSMLISLEPPPPAKDENAENKEDQKENDAESKPSDENTENKKEEKSGIPPPPSPADTAVIESVNENEIVISKEVVIEEAPKDPYEYNGKYKALIDEIESKMDDFQAIIMKVYNLSPDLLPPKTDPLPNDNVAVAETEQTEEERDNLLLEKLTAKFQPNLQVQIQQMQQLLQMQQMTMMSMLAANGGNVGGAAGASMMTLPSGDALPAFGAAATSFFPSAQGQGQKPPVQ